MVPAGMSFEEVLKDLTLLWEEIHGQPHSISLHNVALLVFINVNCELTEALVIINQCCVE